MAVIHSRYPEAGAVSIDRTTCTDCGCCAQICPTRCCIWSPAGSRFTRTACSGASPAGIA